MTEEQIEDDERGKGQGCDAFHGQVQGQRWALDQYQADIWKDDKNEYVSKLLQTQRPKP